MLNSKEEITSTLLQKLINVVTNNKELKKLMLFFEKYETVMFISEIL